MDKKKKKKMGDETVAWTSHKMCCEVHLIIRARIVIHTANGVTLVK